MAIPTALPRISAPVHILSPGAFHDESLVGLPLAHRQIYSLYIAALLGISVLIQRRAVLPWYPLRIFHPTWKACHLTWPPSRLDRLFRKSPIVEIQFKVVLFPAVVTHRPATRAGFENASDTWQRSARQRECV